MTKIIGPLKNIAIVVLAALCVYQAGVLWFVSITNRTSLMNFMPFLYQEAIPDGVSRLVQPWRVILAHPDGHYTVQYNDLQEARRYGDKVISHLFKGGSYISSSPIVHELDVFLALHSHNNNPIYIFEYAFLMEAEWFSLGFGQRGNLLTARGMGAFSRVVIVPPNYGKPDATVFFFSDNGYVHEFVVSPPSEAAFDTDIPEEFFGHNYIWFNDQFIRHGEFFFHTIEVRNPYADAHGGFTMHFVQEQLAPFFNNTAIRTISDDNVFIYRGVSTVVRYYDTHVLEYISYRAIDRNAPTSFINDFSVAYQFLSEDNLVINEVFLSGFSSEYGKNIFYFDYVINNTPLVMPYNWPITHPIIITVDHGTVVNYQKIAFNFHTNEQVWGVATADFRNIQSFDYVRMGFRIGNRNIEHLHWFADERTFPVPHDIARTE